MQSELFQEATRKSINFTAVMIGVVALVVMVGIGYAVFIATRPEGRTVDDILAAEVRDTAVMMLAQPGFSGEEFRSQVLGKGRLVKYVRSLKDAYFTYPASDDEEFQQFVSTYFKDPAKLEFAKPEGAEIKLGGYALPADSPTRFFRTSLENIQIPQDKNLVFDLGEALYEVTLPELRAFANNSVLYGGNLLARVPERSGKPLFVFGNHATMVAKPNEPSLQRLTQMLLRDVGPNREARIQRLVDFVSNNIEYSYTEAVGTSETLKRASETLMTRSGDCSNKTILLASLLEQIGEEYILLYCPQHITVAVWQGNFVNENKLDFTWGDKQWVIAETTLPGFQVGSTRVADSSRLTRVNYVQDPKNSNVIFDANSFEVLKFF